MLESFCSTLICPIELPCSKRIEIINTLKILLATTCLSYRRISCSRIIRHKLKQFLHRLRLR